MSDNPLQELLDELHQAGEWSSQGSFTLNREKAAEKLARFRLPEPHYYVLNLVAASFAAGAKALRFRIDSDDLELSYDLDPYSVDELRGDLSALALHQDEPRLFELGVAMQAAGALAPSRLWLQCDGRRLRYRPGKAPEQEPAEPGFGFWLRETPGSRTLRKLVTGQRPEQLLLQERCCRARAPIVVNGTAINLANEREEYTVAALLEHPDIELPTAPRTRLTRAAAGPFAGWLGLAQHQPDENIWVVVHGVSFPLDRPLDIPGVEGTIFCDALKKDLSQQRLLRDQTFWNLHFELAELARHLWTLLPWPPNASRALPTRDEAGEQAPLQNDEQLSGRAIVRQREGDRKLVLLPSPCHTGRVFYGPGEDFLDTQLSRLGVGTLTVSHPICNPLFWGVYPDFDQEDWAGVVANQVLQAGWEEAPVAGWNVPFALVELLHRAFRERGLRLTRFHLLLAPPWPPEQFELTRQGVVDTDSMTPWPGPEPDLAVGYPSKYLVIDAPLKLSPWDFPFQVSYAQAEAELPLCRAMTRLALAQKEALGSGPVPLVNIPNGDFPFFGLGAEMVARALVP